MSAEVQSQFYLFFLAVFWGIGMCLAYDGLRILRNLIRHSLFWINAEDLLYWAVMTAVLFYLLFTYNRGEIRSFTIAGILTGSLFYLKTISPVYISLLSRALSPFFCLFRKIRQILRKFRQNSGDRY
ncbi:spore cortex biosynthesis protein YabQ [Frisingicoccus sp.]|uniref:spore cortex biosynthesis protein YabQ n=1 Tax=Frisingicoccus sp. TaxID=1918627 RepID=UPI002E77A36E|nr:spore cortex biosynthesis protein YabQ [Frisingicoccus sp.]MEE0752609.1 spore cortex biosynthesis protein YabQ [Frisingicoccus sp.]